MGLFKRLFGREKPHERAAEPPRRTSVGRRVEAQDDAVYPKTRPTIEKHQTAVRQTDRRERSFTLANGALDDTLIPSRPVLFDEEDAATSADRLRPLLLEDTLTALGPADAHAESVSAEPPGGRQRQAPAQKPGRRSARQAQMRAAGTVAAEKPSAKPQAPSPAPIAASPQAQPTRRRRADRWRSPEPAPTQDVRTQAAAAPAAQAQTGETKPDRQKAEAVQAPAAKTKPLPPLNAPIRVPPRPQKLAPDKPATPEELETTGSWFDGIVKVGVSRPEPWKNPDSVEAVAKVLEVLAKDDGIMQRNMMRQLGVDARQLNIVLVDMIAKGLIIRRYSRDRTIAFVYLTDEGRRIAGIEPPQAEAAVEEAPEAEAPPEEEAAEAPEPPAEAAEEETAWQPNLERAREEYAKLRIPELGMSVRATNALMRGGYRFAAELLDLTEETLLSIRNMGQKSAEEVLAMRGRIERGEIRIAGAPVRRDATYAELQAPVERDGYLYASTAHCMARDAQVSDLHLPRKAQQTLYSLGYLRTKQLSGLSFDMLSQLPNVGTQMAIDILNALEEVSVHLPIAVFTDAYRLTPQFKAAGMLAQQCRALTIIRQETMEAYFAQGIETYLQANEIGTEGLTAEALLEDETLMRQLFAEENMRRILDDKVLTLLKAEPYGMPVDLLAPHLPAAMQAHGLVAELVESLQAAGRVTLRDGVAALHYPSIRAYIDGIEDDRRRRILQMWLEDETLEATGRAVGLTRERVRQIIEQEKRRFPTVEEDRYRPLYARYALTREAFETILDAPPHAWAYLHETEEHGEAPLESMVEDDTLPAWMRKQAERFVYRGTILVDGQRVRRTRNDLVDFVLRTHCRDEVTFDAFLQLYDDLLEAQQIEKTEAFVLHEGTTINRLIGLRNVLWKQGRRLRYYDMDRYDFAELIETLSLDQYDGVEYSTLKFFREYPALMQAYDIRDEYELHNLLRKVCTGPECGHLNFKRMPCIAFGEVDRAAQALSLMMRLAPISPADLAAAYEDAYGVRAATVASGYLRELEPYLHDGVYRVDVEPMLRLPPEVVERLRGVLSEDFYTLAQLRRIYLLEVPGAEAGDLNPYAVAELGFKVYTDYVVRDTYSTAAEYFRMLLLTGPDIVEMQDFPEALRMRMQWTLAALCQEYELLAFGPTSYVSIRRLEGAGVTRETLAGFGEDVERFVDHDTMFTMTSLRGKGFVHPLDALGFDAYFYMALLQQRSDLFTSQRIGQTRVFVRGERPISRTDFIAYLVEPAGKTDVYDLVQLMEETYGVVLEKAVVIELVRTSDMHYDPIMECVYKDYETYFEEV